MVHNFPVFVGDIHSSPPPCPVATCPVRVDTQVFSAFGFVQKIATFEKSAGFQVCDSIGAVRGPGDCQQRQDFIGQQEHSQVGNLKWVVSDGYSQVGIPR
ncbi:unnamed protein product [Closterium sp. NIES-54]